MLLLDEVEKAHPDVFNVLLQVLDDGRLTDGKGRTVDFTQCLVLMTSNIGGMDDVKRFFKPEFLNRLDEIVEFAPLAEDQLESIVSIQIDRLREQAAMNGIQLDVGPDAIAFLAKAGYDPAYGARPLKRAIQKHVVDLIAREMISGTIGAGDHVAIEVSGDALAARRVGHAETVDA